MEFVTVRSRTRTGMSLSKFLFGPVDGIHEIFGFSRTPEADYQRFHDALAFREVSGGPQPRSLILGFEDQVGREGVVQTNLENLFSSHQQPKCVNGLFLNERLTEVARISPEPSGGPVLEDFDVSDSALLPFSVGQSQQFGSVTERDLFVLFARLDLYFFRKRDNRFEVNVISLVDFAVAADRHVG
jgi:hypothetical protein